MAEDRGRRRYASLRRATQAEQTRGEIARAARSLFVSAGWAATTVRAVAEKAGVSVPTVYAAYGDKAGLVRAVADAADLSAEPNQLLAELERGSATPRHQLTAMAGFDRRLYERAGDVVVLVREAGRTEPELAAAYREGRSRASETRTETFSAWPRDTLRAGLDVPTAVDVYAALCNVDVYLTLRDERGWSPDKIEEWWSGALVRELLRETHSD